MKELVGPYRILSALGHGGMGIVYLGVHDHLGREVAVKALAPELTQHPQFRDRFFAEARVQAKLQHTNIVTIYDLIEDEGSYFIVMENVQGPTLETLLKEGAGKPLDLGFSLAVFRQILAGLDYAHSRGVIHRDVKPSNVLIAEGELAKLTDFGIALLVGDKRLTASQTAIGTPAYMSPEQILRPRSVDHRSDVYSAAIVLYEMLAGQPPFDAETEYEIKKLQIEAPVPDIRERNERVPAGTAEALSTALRKEPDERFQSAGAFLRALSPDPGAPQVRSLEKIEAASASEPPRRRSLQRPMLAAALVLVATLSLLAYVRLRPVAQPSIRPIEAPPPLQMEPAPAGQVQQAVNLEPAVLAPRVVEMPPQTPPVRKEAAKKAEPSDPAKAELAALKTGIWKRLERVRRNIERHELEEARQEIETLRSIVEGQPHGLEAEQASLQRLEQEHQRAEKEALAREEPKTASSAPVEQAQELKQVHRRQSRRLVITSIEVQPPIVSPGRRAVAVARATVDPPFQQAEKLNIRVRVMKNLGEIAKPISQAVTIPAGGSTWVINIPLKIPSEAPIGDCYIDVEVQDSTREVVASRRLGFTVQ